MAGLYTALGVQGGVVVRNRNALGGAAVFKSRAVVVDTSLPAGSGLTSALGEAPLARGWKAYESSPLFFVRWEAVRLARAERYVAASGSSLDLVSKELWDGMHPHQTPLSAPWAERWLSNDGAVHRSLDLVSELRIEKVVGAGVPRIRYAESSLPWIDGTWMPSWQELAGAEEDADWPTLARGDHARKITEHLDRWEAILNKMTATLTAAAPEWGYKKTRVLGCDPLSYSREDPISGLFTREEAVAWARALFDKKDELQWNAPTELLDPHGNTADIVAFGCYFEMRAESALFGGGWKFEGALSGQPYGPGSLSCKATSTVRSLPNTRRGQSHFNGWDVRTSILAALRNSAGLPADDRHLEGLAGLSYLDYSETDSFDVSPSSPDAEVEPCRALLASPPAPGEIPVFVDTVYWSRGYYQYMEGDPPIPVPESEYSSMWYEATYVPTVEIPLAIQRDFAKLGAFDYLPE